MQLNNSRSPVTTWSNSPIIVDFQDNGAVCLNIREISSVILRLVFDVSMSGVGIGIKGPVANVTHGRSVCFLAIVEGRVLLEEALALVLGLQFVRCGVLGGGIPAP